MVEETQEVEWCKVNALFSIQYDFVAGWSTMEKCLSALQNTVKQYWAEKSKQQLDILCLCIFDNVRNTKRRYQHYQVDQNNCGSLIETYK